MIIGICGKSGSGKSTLSRFIVKECDGIYIDIDKIGHDVLTINEVKEELKKSFGESVVCGSVVDRKKLGELVFNSRDEMRKLSDITWKYMQIEIDKIINSNKDKVIVLDWILLPITKYLRACDIKIILDIPYEIRKERAMLRDDITGEDFDLREKASIDFNLNDFDYVVRDSKEVKELVKKLW